MRTAEVRALVREVLSTMQPPYSHHVIDEVFEAIESNRNWRQRYDSLCAKLGRDVVNNWGGRWIAITLEKSGEQQVTSKKSTLIGSYSILDADAITVTQKPDRADAKKMMEEHYKAHKARLPANIKEFREAIIQLLMDGLPPEEAFAAAVQSGA